MLAMLDPTSSSTRVVILISLISIFSTFDSQFIKLFYGTSLDTPDYYHLLLFLSVTVAISAINAILLLFTRVNEFPGVNKGKLPLNYIYIGVSITQYAISFIFFLMIMEMVLFAGYSSSLVLMVILLSHICSIAILGMISFTFVQWFRSSRSFSIVVYGAVFITILFLTLITSRFLIEQVNHYPPIINSRPYSSVVLDVLPPSANISFTQELGKYVFPILVASSWIITILLLRHYAIRIGKTVFWIAVSIPLAYQVFAYIISDANIITDPELLDIVYSKEFQLLVGINNQISGLFFGMAFLVVGIKIKRKQMRNYLMISCIGIVSLFCSMSQTLAIYAAYPPFGILTFMFLAVSSYLLFVGIIGSARYISRDVEFRRSLYEGLDVEFELFKNMGMAEIQREISGKVESILPQIQPIGISQDDLDPEEDREEIKRIIEEVVNELHSKSSLDRSPPK
jgi:hypothetical protein